MIVANTTAGSRRDRLLRRVFVRTLPPALNRPFMAALPAERKEFLEVMRAEVFPYLPHSVLGELGDQQRLRMLTARKGAAEDLVELNRALRRPAEHGDGELPTYRLGTKLDQLLGAEERQVGAPRLATEPILCHASRARDRLTLVVNLEEPALSAGRLSLTAWISGSAESADFGSEASRAGSTLTFVINARRLSEEGIASVAKPADQTIEVHEYVLLLEAQRKGRRVGASPIKWPETLDVTTVRLDRGTRSPPSACTPAPAVQSSSLSRAQDDHRPGVARG